MKTSETSNSPESSSQGKTADIKKFRDAYNSADELSREVANFRDDVAIPANNELRYASHHFLSAIGDGGQVTKPDELQKAINHCHRAMYEAVDAGVISALNQIKDFKLSYSTATITDVIPGYLDILKRADKAKSLSARKRDHSDRTVIVSKEYLDLFRELENDCLTIDVSRDELNKKIEEQKRGYRRWMATILLTILGILLTFKF